MNLRTALEPLIPELWEKAEAKYMELSSADYSMPDSREAGTEQVAEMKQAFEQVVAPALTDLVSRLRGYYSLDDFDLGPIADQFATETDRWEEPSSSLFGHLVAASHGITKVLELVHSDQWQGAAAMAFKTQFLDPFESSVYVQLGCAREVAIAARSLHRAVELAKESVVWICKNTIWNFNATPGGEFPGPLPGEESEGGGKKIAGMTAILADTAAMFFAFIPGLDMLDFALAGTGVVGGLIAESGSPSEMDVIAFEAAFDTLPQYVISAAQQALSGLDDLIFRTDGQIGLALDADLGVSGPFSKAEIQIYSGAGYSDRYPNGSPMPMHGEHSGPGGLIGEPDELTPSAYQPPKGEHGGLVVVNFKDLYWAGTINLPLVAEQYAFGRRVCNRVHITGVDKQFPVSVHALNDAAETFGGSVQRIHDHCITYAEAMVAAAKDLDWADARQRQDILDVEAKIKLTDPNLPPNAQPPAWVYD